MGLRYVRISRYYNDWEFMIKETRISVVIVLRLELSQVAKMMSARQNCNRYRPNFE